MIKSYTMQTAAIDDADRAVADLRDQLEKLELLGHSVGIVVCHYDFITGGAMEAIAGMMPFPLIGLTTFYQVTPGCDGMFDLTITVLTSDDVRFAVAYDNTDLPRRDSLGAVRGAYERAVAQHGEAPALIFSFLSVHRPVSGDEYLRLLDACSGGVPSVGAVATGDDEIGLGAYVMCGEHAFAEGFAMLLLCGEVEAGFYYGNFNEERLLEMTATVTEAEGTKVKQLNGMPAVPFLRKMGFEMRESEKISNIPYLYKRPGKSLMIARTLGGYDEDGALNFLAEVPENVILRVGMLSIEDTLEVSGQTIGRALEERPDAAALLLFSCVGRYITLGLDPTLEMEQVTKVIPEDKNYLACYVGGEICPVMYDGKPVNCFHNASFVVCTLS